VNDNVLLLYGTECPKCTRPAKSHNFRIGLTIHESPLASHCRIHEPRPHLSNGGGPHAEPAGSVGTAT
jgi:hypothetical protein